MFALFAKGARSVWVSLGTAMTTWRWQPLLLARRQEVGPFAIQAQMDEVQADVAAGLEMINAEDSALRLYYDGHFGDTVQVQSVGLKGSTKF